MPNSAQRMLMATPEGVIEGWMDEDAATSSAQLMGDGPSGSLVIDSREILRSTARVVGANFGELHVKTWMALVTIFVNDGLPEDGSGSSTIGELSRTIWGAEKGTGGGNTKRVVGALLDLYRAEVSLPGFNIVTGEASEGLSMSRLLSDLHVDEAIRQAFDLPGSLTSSDAGKRFGASRGETIWWVFNKRYADRLAQSELRRFDWSKAHQLRGTAMAMWLLFGSPRVPYREYFGGGDPELEHVWIPLTIEQCQALGVHASPDAARRRTLSQAGARVCAADPMFVSIEAHGGRGRESALHVVRRRSSERALLRPYEQTLQLTLTSGG